jgi:hypothetical protein
MKHSRQCIFISSRPPEEALKIITKSFTVKRRLHYFNDLMAAEPMPSPLALSTASKYWDKLRSNWKEAVKVELSNGYPAWESKHIKNPFWKLIADNYQINKP